MSRDDNSARETWRRLNEDFAELIRSASDEETEEWFAHDHEAADRCREAVDRAIVTARRILRERLERHHRAQLDEILGWDGRLPATPQARRLLLERVRRERPEVVVCYREFRNLTDGDVESLLRRLGALGALDGMLEEK